MPNVSTASLTLDVAQLANVEVTSSPTLGPPEKDVADRLHEPLTVHDALSVVGEDSTLPAYASSTESRASLT